MTHPITARLLRKRITDLRNELREPVVRAAVYTDEFDQGRSLGEDNERLAIADRLDAILKETSP